MAVALAGSGAPQPAAIAGMVVGYMFALKYFGEEHSWVCTRGFGVPFAYITIQNIYIAHDVTHGATFPPYPWQKFLTH